MKNIFSPLLAAMLTVGAVAAAAQTPPPPPPESARTQALPYVAAAGQSDLFEIDSSRIAVQKSQTPAVRRYADMLITHHQKTTAATLAAAKQSGLTPPSPMPDPGATASIGELQAASPADFDRVYLAQQVPAHQAALDLHRSYAASGDQAALRKSAMAAVPIVTRHLTAAQKLQSAGNAGKRGM